MNIRLAHEKYIQFLITQRYSLNEANNLLDIYSLPNISAEDWGRIYNGIFSLRVPKKIKDYWLNKEIEKPKNYNSIFQSLFLQLDEANKNSEDFKHALSILDNHEAHKICKAMIIKKLSNNDISALINGKLSLGINEISISIFEKYFFNVREFSRIDWKNYYKFLSDGQDKKFIIDCFQNDTESLKILLGLHAKISYTDSLQLIHVVAMEKFKSLARDRNPISDSGARKWVDIVLKTGDRYEKYKSKSFKDFSEEIQMEFEYQEHESGNDACPSIMDLKGEVV